jgi:hypothetical protein
MATMIVGTNSYCSLDDADTYHEKRLFVTDWTGETDDDNKEAALMWATRLIDEKVEWSGFVITGTPALGWPRSMVYDRNGHAFSQSEIPTWLADATAEFARELIAENRTAETNRDTIGFKKMKVGELALEMNSFAKKPVMPPAVWSIIKFYCRKIGTSRTLVRV